MTSIINISTGPLRSIKAISSSLELELPLPTGTAVELPPYFYFVKAEYPTCSLLYNTKSQAVPYNWDTIKLIHQKDPLISLDAYIAARRESVDHEPRLIANVIIRCMNTTVRSFGHFYYLETHSDWYESDHQRYLLEYINGEKV